MTAPATAAAWDRALSTRMRPAPLLQSWGWGEVQAREGWQVRRVELAGGLATVLVSGRGRLRTGKVARGPVPATAETLRQLVDWARGEGLARLHVEPDAPPELGPALREAGFKPARAAEPRHTLIVRLGLDEDMLGSFKSKHRYNIRLAEKKGVTVEQTRDAAEMERQALATAGRQGIVQARAAYYERRLQLLQDCRIYVARHEGEALAAIFVAHHEGRAYYLYGGSSERKRQLMPTYAVQWAAMRGAAADGCHDYDLWGLPPDDDPTHPWHGLWQFKTGFGGAIVEYVGAWSIVLDVIGGRAAESLEGVRRAARPFRRLLNR